ncbi:dTDP-4-dehydrorhamnose 3,5-epimerase family protein [Pseudacidovorax intermedius]|uniref:dTDP-4-dehydrorhamnose 3,5-epimerase n=1 Tax=Pseudacidovorax intermedius TaxID=433924 RepID=A0A147GRY9_9BURK|nr:dTDP-4-dehydrorhamnose 3,5-epimerase family protein [Pseudacidovorax intermedius]KTT19290.1 dTDP-4-dehydrorhamnose 3,5-epimerase [Pseudacidovorax intermedius]
MQFQKRDSKIEGCFEVLYKQHADSRGFFMKTSHTPSFAELGINETWTEEYFSSSIKGVIRGMHFQTPPFEHAKIVTCLTGRILDVVLDLRSASPSFGEYTTFELSKDIPSAVFIPRGCAHGFLSLADESLMFYKVTSVHAPTHDAGVLWNSFGFKWPVENPILSERDSRFARFEDFTSPF